MISQATKDDEVDVCSCCGKQLKCTISEEWHIQTGESVIVKTSAIPYILADLSSGEICLCEDCYINDKFKQMPDADMAEIHYQFGLEYERLELLSKSVDALHHSLKLRKTADALAALAVSYKSLGDLQLARELYHQALELDPNHFMSRENLKNL